MDDRDALTEESLLRIYVAADGAWRMADGAKAPADREIFVYAALPFEREDCPPLPGLIRCAGSSIVFVEMLPTSTAEKPLARVTFLAFVDLKGSVPGTAGVQSTTLRRYLGSAF